MKTVLYALPILAFLSFLVMSGLTGFRFISRARRDGESGRPFAVKETRRSAIISGLYMTLALVSVAILGPIVDTEVDALSVIGCFALPSVPLGVIVAIGNYFRAKQAHQLARKLSQRKSLL